MTFFSWYCTCRLKFVLKCSFFFNYVPTGLIENSISVDQCAVNCQTIIDLVASDILNVDLSHISGKGIVQGDKGSIRNLLEIFAGLLEYFMECIDDEGK